MFKVDNKDTKTTLTMAMASFWCLHCQLGTYFTPCSNVFIVNFEQVNAHWVEPFFDLLPKVNSTSMGKICFLQVNLIVKQDVILMLFN